MAATRRQRATTARASDHSSNVDDFDPIKVKPPLVPTMKTKNTCVKGKLEMLLSHITTARLVAIALVLATLYVFLYEYKALAFQTIRSVIAPCRLKIPVCSLSSVLTTSILRALGL
jgi:hypothetical protein